TRVEITPSEKTRSGRPKQTAFIVDLNKGQLYNVMGAIVGSSLGNDMSGSKIQSIVGADGKCHPISVFSGSSRTMVCPPTIGSGDFIMQQVFPATAWGARYLAGLTSSSDGATILNPNRFRVYVRDRTTRVLANGSVVTGLVNGSFYDFSAATSQYITADKPIMVAQLIPSQDGCGSSGKGDPELIFLSPMEQAIKNVSFYNTNKENILVNYLTLVVPQQGLSSLLIDGSAAVDHSYAHPGLPGYQVVVKQLATTPAQHNVQCDSGFNAITYGLGVYESYGYNAGSYINNLTYLTELKNDLSTNANTYTCPETPFTITVKTLYTATGVIWHFGQVPGFTPTSNIVVNNAVAAGTEVINGKTYNVYKQPVSATAPGLGTYYVPVTIISPAIDNCTNSDKLIVEVKVQAGPTADYTYVPACATDTSFFTGSSIEPAVDQWLWDFSDGATSTLKQAERIYSAGGNYAVKLRAGRSVDGCVVNVTKTVNVPGMPNAAFDIPVVVCMPTNEAKFVNRTTIIGAPASALQYSWTFGDGNTATDMSPTHYYATRGSYPVTLIAASAAGCRDTTDGVVANFADRPVAGFDVAEPAVCAGKEFLFTDKSIIPGNVANASWKWTFGDGSTATGSTPEKLYKQANTYTVAMHVISSEGCISDTASRQVQVYPVPIVDAGPDVITEPGRAVLLKASVSPATADIVWTPASFLSSANLLQPMANPPETQRYYITATGEHDCSSTDSMLLKVFKELKIPNAFTPNGDGRNDTWHIPGLEDYRNATVQVFNRWGQVVYKCTGYSNPWNGSMNGNKLPTGAYYYIIQPKENGYGTLSGMVMIVR
ncbi:MAG TPA: PKD domain-containing protein, partial [Niastella sp.]